MFRKKVSSSVIIVKIFAVIMMFAFPLASAGPSIGKSERTKPRIFTLSLIAYNYTRKNIENYSINGISGGHVFFSSSTSGGSGEVCCVTIHSDSEHHIRVRWQNDGCNYVVKSISGKTYDQRHLFYKEVAVNSVNNVMSPRYLETHFHADGRVEVLLTERPSLPLVALSTTRDDLSNFKRCKDDKRPAW